MRLAEKWEKLSTLQQAAGRSAALGEISMSELSATRHSGLWKNQPKLFLFPLGAAAQGSGLSAVAQLSDVAPWLIDFAFRPRGATQWKLYSRNKGKLS